MEARIHRLHLPHLRVAMPHAAGSRLAAFGAACGVLGGLVMAVPLVLYGWLSAAHGALELPAAATAWLFGLEHFGQNEYRWGPIVVGTLFLALYWALHGMAFAGLADRVHRVRTAAGALALGGAWSVASFLVFWDMVLPLARDGAPFRLTAAGEYVAPSWVWIVAFTVFGLATALSYLALRRTARLAPEVEETRPVEQRAA